MKAEYIGNDLLREVPEMQKPEMNFWSGISYDDAADHLKKKDEYEKQLNTCKTFPITGSHSFEVGKEYVEGVDFEIAMFDVVTGWRLGYNSKEPGLPPDAINKLFAIPLPKEPGQDEKIVCAAIWYKEQTTAKILPNNIKEGIVVGGLRHSYCIATFVALTGKRSVLPECGEYVQGFLTTKDRFVDRNEAMGIAKASGQVTSKQSFEELYSEDLY
jgi:hypothetical protein